MGSHDSREEYNSYMRDYMRKRIAYRKAAAIEILGGKCASCGTQYNLGIKCVKADATVRTAGQLGGLSERRFIKELSNWSVLCQPCAKPAKNRTNSSAIYMGHANAFSVLHYIKGEGTKALCGANIAHILCNDQDVPIVYADHWGGRYSNCMNCERLLKRSKLATF